MRRKNVTLCCFASYCLREWKTNGRFEKTAGGDDWFYADEEQSCPDCGGEWGFVDMGEVA